MEDDIELSGENPGVFCCRHDKNYYLMSEYGTKLTKNYKGIWGPRNGYYLYQDYNGLRGYLNQDGSIAIPAQYKMQGNLEQDMRPFAQKMDGISSIL